jgi:isopentenyl-diphosphate delta-isomerase
MGNGENMRVSQMASSYCSDYVMHYINRIIVDYILFIKPSAKVVVHENPNEVQATDYVSADQLKEMFKDKNLKFTPWFKLICESMLFEWWEHLDEGLDKYLNETEIRRMLNP